MPIRQLSDGTLLDPLRPIINCPEGYEPHPHDKNRCLPILVDCIFRKLEFRKGSCCPSGTNKLVCTYIKKDITKKDCVECKADPVRKFGSSAKE